MGTKPSLGVLGSGDGQAEGGDGWSLVGLDSRWRRKKPSSSGCNQWTGTDPREGQRWGLGANRPCRASTPNCTAMRPSQTGRQEWGGGKFPDRHGLHAPEIPPNQLKGPSLTPTCAGPRPGEAAPQTAKGGLSLAQQLVRGKCRNQGAAGAGRGEKMKGEERRLLTGDGNTAGRTFFSSQFL